MRVATLETRQTRGGEIRLVAILDETMTARRFVVVRAPDRHFGPMALDPITGTFRIVRGLELNAAPTTAARLIPFGVSKFSDAAALLARGEQQGIEIARCLEDEAYLRSPARRRGGEIEF